MREIEYKGIAAQSFMNRRGSFYLPVPISTLKKWRKLGFRTGKKASPLTKNEKYLIDGLERASEKYSDLIDLDQLLGSIKEVYPEANTEWLAVRLKTLSKELADAGVFEKTPVRNGVSGGTMLFAMQSPEKAALFFGDQTPVEVIASLAEGQRGKARIAAKTQKRLREIYDVLSAHSLAGIASLDTGEPWSYYLVTQLLERCSRHKQTDPRRQLTAPITLDGEIIFAEAAATVWSDSEDPMYGVITESDAQIILAILSIAMQTINRQGSSNKPLSNRISIDLAKLAKQLNTGNELATYRAFQRGFTRVINTEFKLTAQPDSKMAARIKEKTGQPGERVRFRLVDKVIEGSGDEQAVVDSADWNPSNNLRYLTFSLADWIWRDLFDGRGWIVHPGLLTERSGLTHKLYNHLKAHSSLTKPYTVNGDQLEKLLNQPSVPDSYAATPGRRTRQFCRKLWSIWHEHAMRSTGHISLVEQIGRASCRERV